VSARLEDFVKARGWDNLDRVLTQTGAFAADKATAQAAYDAQRSAAYALIPQALEHLSGLTAWPLDNWREARKYIAPVSLPGRNY
jgi:hypothetical protein